MVQQKKFIYLVVALVMSAGILQAAQTPWQQEFCQSFISHYECSPEGRYTHEYHPFILEQTSRSLDALEQRLKDSGIELDGRLVIAGYEEDAMPRYYTFFRQPIIDDEASRKNNGGWSAKLHNMFGFMTAYFFKDCLCSENCSHFFHHINVDSIVLFNKFATVFQKHAFGKQALGFMDRVHEVVCKKILANDVHGVLGELVRFWTFLYENDIKVRDAQLAGTQDILFSVEYAKHLMRSSVPMLSYYTGPDITYPIEVTVKQKKEATKNAQDFAHVFSRHLLARHEQRTAYVFCSFVDGVGKSTMLGNIKNWLIHGEHVEAFEHVDNSSSQLATLFQYSEKVYIADLPAQVSHFTYKPDGDVFVDARTELSSHTYDGVCSWYRDHKLMVDQAYDETLAQTKKEVASSGYFAPSLNDRRDPEKAFVRNVVLLKKENNWVPFLYEGKHYLINKDQPNQLRCLVPLSSIKSEGLKNIEAQQMLFFDGVRFPYPYEYFLSNFIALLKGSGIERVVFVDFLSMYPRSSRENIRINYLLQQQALLDQSFDYWCSFYKDFVSGGELLYCLQDRLGGRLFRQSMTQEALVRMTLYDFIINRTQGDIEGFSVQALTERLGSAIGALNPGVVSELQKMVDKKIHHQIKVLEKDYGLSKLFINVQLSSVGRAVAFSQQLQTFFNTVVYNEQLNTLYERRNALFAGLPECGQGLMDRVEKDQSGRLIKVYYKLDIQSKDPMLITPFVRMIRANWYALFSDLFFNATQPSERRIEIKKLLMRVAPVVLERGEDGFVYVTQHFLEPWQNKIDKRTEYLSNHIFRLRHQAEGAYGEYAREEYRTAWECEQTNKALYGFATNPDLQNNNSYFSSGDDEESILSYFLQNYQKDHGVSTVMPASVLLKETQKDTGRRIWAFECKSLWETAQNNGLYGQSENKDGKKASRQKKSADARQVNVYVGLPEDKARVRMIVRLLATLEMVIKDPESNVVVRYGDHDDFKAALKLFEKTILPYYFGVMYQEDLFDDYDRVEPFPSWDFWADHSS